MEKTQKTEYEWQKSLTAEQFHVLREAGTEAPGTGALLKNKKKGVYACGGCGQKLFSSETKFDSGTGWPSFYDAIGKDKIKLKKDFKMILPRTEVLCSKCGGHLGHLFSDAPETPTGKRYCLNSVALGFEESKK